MWRGHCEWVTATLRTTTSIPGNRDFPRISLRPPKIIHTLDDPDSGTDPTSLRNTIGETKYQEYLELDRLLTHLSESRSTQLRILYNVPPWLDGRSRRSCVESLFPEVTAGGMIEFVKCMDIWG